MRYQVGKAIEQERVGRIVNVVKEMEDSLFISYNIHLRNLSIFYENYWSNIINSVNMLMWF